MKRGLWIFLLLTWNLYFLGAQDPVLISRLSNTQITTQINNMDTLAIVSTIGEPMSGIYRQGEVIFSFEPFFFFFPQGPSWTQDLPVISGLSVFPNPARDVAFLKRENADEVFIIRLYNVSGSQLLQSTWKPGEDLFEIRLHAPDKGMYFLMVSDEELTKASQFKVVLH